MTDTAGSSPLSEPPEPNTPAEVEERAPSSRAEPAAAAAAPVASTSSHPPRTLSKTRKEQVRPRRKSTGTVVKKESSGSNLAAIPVPVEVEPCPACRQLDAKGKAKTRQVGTVWVECDKCEAWYHWSCVSANPKDTPDSIDKWYCEPCLNASLSTPAPLTISYKLIASHLPVPAPATAPTNVRKSGRSTKSQIDYSNLHEHRPASVDRWAPVIAARTHSGQIKPDRFERKLARDLTHEWVYGPDGMLEPFVVETPQGLGMSMPRRDITVGEIAELIGPDTPLEVIDCASQSSLSNWTLGQWAQYYAAPDRDKVRNVISLEVSDTKLGKMVVAPELVRNLDWVDTIWPDDMKVPGQYPRVQKYCLMSVEKCWTDWHVDFAGSSVFYHVLKGGKTFYFIRPTPANLAAYEKWSGSTERQEQEWLGDSCDEVLKIELKEGNTAFLPTGWIHAVYTPADSIVIGGNFLHSLNIPTQLRIYEIELATKVPKKFRYPHFVKLLWLVAIHYEYYLSRLPLPPTPDTPIPLTLSPRVLEGLLALSSFLINQTTRFVRSAVVSAERRRIARENVPWNKVADPVALSREFRKSVLRAMARELDAECFKPHGAEEDDAAPGVVAPVANGGGGATAAMGGKKGAAGGGVKRKGTEEPVAGLAKTARIKLATSARGSPPPGAAVGGGGLLQNQGEIISRQAVPAPPTTRFEPRVDPKRPQLGARPAEVRETKSSQFVVRRWEENGETFVETRSVHTIIERVKWSSSNNVKTEGPDSDSRPTSSVSSSSASALPQLPSGSSYLGPQPSTAVAHHGGGPHPPFPNTTHQYPAPQYVTTPPTTYPWPYPPPLPFHVAPGAHPPPPPLPTQPFAYGPYFSQPPQFAGPNTAPAATGPPPAPVSSQQQYHPSPPVYPTLGVPPELPPASSSSTNAVNSIPR